MSKAIIVELYDECRTGGNLALFGRKVGERYLEGTLQRLLTQPDARTREAALVALRFVGTMAVNASLAACLRDRDRHIRELAEEALWAVWFRADTAAHTEELQRLTQLLADKHYIQALSGLNALTHRAPQFAEAFNQRAILHWRRGDYRLSIADCERVIKLNNFHFGAQSGMAQCYLHLKKPVEALRAYRRARRIHPHLEGVDDSIRALEQYLREERRRRRDDRR